VKILLAGQKRFGQEVLYMLLSEGNEVVACACPADGEDDKTWIGCQNKSVPVIPAGTLNAQTVPTGVDLIVAAHSHDFIGRATRNATRYGAIGYHPSLLPLHRGRDAIKWAIKMHDRVTGGTVYWLNDTVDGGPVLAQDWCFIRPEDDALELWKRDLSPMGVRLLRDAVKAIASGRVPYAEQDHTLATWEPSTGGAPRLYRPDLPQIGANGITFVERVDA
jgi:methionyl-tRNA formyltransferase